MKVEDTLIYLIDPETGTRRAIENHQPFVVACLIRVAMRRASGERVHPVLEMGMGNYSTPLLHCACEAAGIPLVSVECDGEWANRFASLAGPNHTILVEENFDALPVFSRPWSLALVDHGPNPRRPKDLLRLKGHAELIVAHDTQNPRYDSALTQFAYRKDYVRDMDECNTRATALSDTDDLQWLTTCS